MYVEDRETYSNAYCGECGRIAETKTLNATGLCNDCASPFANIVASVDATRKWLESIITPQPRGKAEYTQIGTYDMSDGIYDSLIDNLDSLKAKGIAGYRKYPKSLAIVLHKRRNTNEDSREN